ncbi:MULTISPECIES: hypothetical protein [unclassified Acinetobacter]|nr:MULTISPECIES: hypothetical protein [unclassified Acinetobacter]MDC4801381.1 hypothetical protein [Acinetobacter baumannii]
MSISSELVYLYVGIGVLIGAKISELVYLYVGIGVLISCESLAVQAFQAT